MWIVITLIFNIASVIFFILAYKEKDEMLKILYAVFSLIGGYISYMGYWQPEGYDSSGNAYIMEGAQALAVFPLFLLFLNIIFILIYAFQKLGEMIKL